MLRIAGFVASGIALGGCAVGGNAIDQAMTTNAISMAEPAPSIAVDPFAPDRSGDPGQTDRLIDEDTIRLAVTTADLARVQGNALPWASAATGSSGTVSDITEISVAGQSIPSLSASRNAYDGVSLYRGGVCRDARSGWWTRSLAPHGAGDTVQ